MAGNIFKGIGGVKASADAVYIRPGDYIVSIDRIKQDESRKKVDYIAFEMTVLKTINEKPMTFADGSQKPNSHRPGEQVSHLLMFDNDMALPNLKAIVMALFNCEEGEVTDELCLQMVSDSQPMAGMIVKIECNEIITKGKKQPFTKPAYRHTLSRQECIDEGIEIPENAVFLS